MCVLTIELDMHQIGLTRTCIGLHLSTVTMDIDHVVYHDINAFLQLQHGARLRFPRTARVMVGREDVTSCNRRYTTYLTEQSRSTRNYSPTVKIGRAHV